MDIGGLEEEFALSQEQVDDLVGYTVEEVTTEVARFWADEVKQNLVQAKQQYLNALGVEKINKSTSVVFLNPAPWLPNALEKGYNPFDMKSGFLASNKVKYTKKGEPYMTIPFRFGTPEAIGESTAFAGIMPKVIHGTILRNVKSGDSTPLRLGDIPKQFQIPKSASLRKALKSDRFRKLEVGTEMTSIYEGLTQGAGGSGYVNFRRVSLSSQADSWNHPGFEARNFAQKASARVEPMIPSIVDTSIDEYLSSQGF